MTTPALKVAQMAAAGMSTQMAIVEVLTIAEAALARCEVLQRQIDEAKADPVPWPAGKSAGNMRGIVEAVAKGCKAMVSRAVDPLVARLDALEEARHMTFKGPHDPGATYEPGAVTQRNGAAWVALVQTSATPGQSGDWRRLVQPERAHHE